MSINSSDQVRPNNCEYGATRWRRSARCGPDGGNCVEVDVAVESVGVRDSKHPTGAPLRFANRPWATFVHALR